MTELSELWGLTNLRPKGLMYVDLHNFLVHTTNKTIISFYIRIRHRKIPT